MNTLALTTSGSSQRATGPTKIGRLVALLFLQALSGTAFATPVLITAPKTVGPLDTTITPTAGGSPIPLTQAEITVSGTTLTINGRHAVASLALQNNAVVTHATNTSFDYSGNGTDVVSGLSLNIAGNASVAAGSKIDAAARGFPGSTGPGKGTSGGGSCGGGGGGHGAQGGQANCVNVPGGIANGSATEPTTFGSGGGGYPGFTPGGQGGGAIRLLVGGQLAIHGTITADGGTLANASGGAGGSIWIVAQTISGSGSVLARGANQSTSNQSSGGGAGGRIAVSSCSIAPTIVFSVIGGAGGGIPAHMIGGTGTIVSTLNSAPLVQNGPTSTASCPMGVAMFSVTASGVSPIDYRWQIETAPKGSNLWTDLSDGVVLFNGVVVGTGTGSGTKDFSFQNDALNRASFRVRCSMANVCGTALTDPATYSVCTSDFTCDGGVDDADFSVFALAYNILDCADPSMPANCPADLNADGFVDDGDFSIFVVAYNLLLCE